MHRQSPPTNMCERWANIIRTYSSSHRLHCGNGSLKWHPWILYLFAFRFFRTSIDRTNRECRFLYKYCAWYAYSNVVCILYVLLLFVQVVKLICLLDYSFLSLHSFLVVGAGRTVSTASVTWLWHRKLPILFRIASEPTMDIGQEEQNKKCLQSQCNIVPSWMYKIDDFGIYIARLCSHFIASELLFLFKFRTCLELFVFARTVSIDMQRMLSETHLRAIKF